MRTAPNDNHDKCSGRHPQPALFDVATFSIEIDQEDVLGAFYEAEDAPSQCDFPADRVCP